MRRRRHFGTLLGACVAIAAVPCLAQAAGSRVLESTPAASAVISSRTSAFYVRFDRPVDHVRSSLTIMRDGKLVERLEPRLDSAPEVLFARAPTLAEGNYTLHWEVRTLAGSEVDKGDIPFSVKD
jgi:methionine-rich copper-binding protein CopC